MNDFGEAASRYCAKLARGRAKQPKSSNGEAARQTLKLVLEGALPGGQHFLQPAAGAIGEALGNDQMALKAVYLETVETDAQAWLPRSGKSTGPSLFWSW